MRMPCTPCPVAAGRRINHEWKYCNGWRHGWRRRDGELPVARSESDGAQLAAHGGGSGRSGRALVAGDPFRHAESRPVPVRGLLAGLDLRGLPRDLGERHDPEGARNQRLSSGDGPGSGHRHRRAGRHRVRTREMVPEPLQRALPVPASARCPGSRSPWSCSPAGRKRSSS